MPVVSADETGRLARSFNDMVAGLAERAAAARGVRRLRRPDVAQRVLRDGDDLDGEEREVTILCLDIRDFTRFAERASAREVVDRLNEFYGLVVPMLERHGGYADKYLGDGLLGVFGAPEPIADHADRAVAAAIEIAAAVRERYGDELRVGIGVNSGLVIAGTVGGGGRVEFTVIGDPVNTASRVEQVTRQTGDAMLVTEATQRLLRLEHGGFEQRPAAPLKGKSERVELWAPRTLALERAAAWMRAVGEGRELSAPERGRGPDVLPGLIRVVRSSMMAGEVGGPCSRELCVATGRREAPTFPSARPAYVGNEEFVPECLARFPA